MISDGTIDEAIPRESRINLPQGQGWQEGVGSYRVSSNDSALILAESSESAEASDTFNDAEAAMECFEDEGMITDDAEESKRFF